MYACLYLSMFYSGMCRHLCTTRSIHILLLEMDTVDVMEKVADSQSVLRTLTIRFHFTYLRTCHFLFVFEGKVLICFKDLLAFLPRSAGAGARYYAIRDKPLEQCIFAEGRNWQNS